MIGEGSLAERTKAITDELHAMKSLQNMGGLGLQVPAAYADWRGTLTKPDAYSPQNLYFRFTPRQPNGYTPLAFLAVNWEYPSGMIDRVMPPIVTSSSANSITWRVPFDWANGMSLTFTVEAQVISMLEGTLTIWS